MEPLIFKVAGIPIPQGSKRAFIPKGAKRAVVVDQSSHLLMPWRLALAEAVDYEVSTPFEGPVEVTMDFYMPRPKSAKKDAFWAPKRPDLDKLVRAVNDAVTTGGGWHDDSQVVYLKASKQLADKEHPWTGVIVEISGLD